MSEAAELFLVLSAVYLLECAQVVPRAALALKATFGRRLALEAAAPFGLRRGSGVFLGMPLPPLGLLLVVERWPVVLDDEGVRGEDGAVHPWEAARDAGVAEARVTIGAATVATLSTEVGAEVLAAALRAIARARPAERSRRIDEVLRARFDTAAVRRRARAFRAAVWPLRAAASLLFVALFVGGPAVLFTRLSFLSLHVAAAGLLSWIACVVFLVRARTRSLPAAARPPAGKIWVAALWPLAAMRGADVLGRPLLHDVDPLAAAVLLPPEGFRAAARQLLAELRHGVARPSAAFDARVERVALRMLAEEKVDPDTLFDAPAADEDAARAFCPRCRAQYVVERETCAACVEIRLLPLGGAARVGR